MSERSRRTFDSSRHEHRAPSDCPVCGGHLSVTRLGCGSCGSELAGVFAPCLFCALSDKENELLQKLGLAEPAEPTPLTRDQILSEVASGALSPAEAQGLLTGLS